MKNSLFLLVIAALGSMATAQNLIITPNVGVSTGVGTITTTTTTTTTNSPFGSTTNTSYDRNVGNNTYTITNSNSPGGGVSNTNYSNNNGYNNNTYNNNSYTNGYNNGYGNGYNNGYGNSNNYNNGYNNQSNYTYSNDGYGSTVEIEDDKGNRTIIETTTDSTAALERKSVLENISKHIVHFTGLVMSDAFDDGDLSKAYVMDKYSEFLKPGKYGNISSTLPNSVKYTFDGIAIPPKTRLIIYSGSNFTGDKLVDITGPAIINNSKWQTDDRYMTANTKTYCTELQTTFPQSTRQWSINDMHNWQNGSIEIIEIP